MKSITIKVKVVKELGCYRKAALMRIVEKSKTNEEGFVELSTEKARIIGGFNSKRTLSQDFNQLVEEGYLIKTRENSNALKYKITDKYHELNK